MSTPAGLLRPLTGVGAAAVLIVAGLAPLPVLANPRAETVLAALPFNANEQRRILAGELVTTASAERTSDRELAITMAFLVAAPPTDLAARFERASGYELHDSARAWGELTGAGGAAELQHLRLAPNGDAEARRFAGASAGTDLNLSTAEIAALRALPGPNTAAVEATLRELLLARFQAYRQNGLAGIAPYDRGNGRSSSPGEFLGQATRASKVLAAEAPEVVTALLQYPRSQPAAATQKFFWVVFDVDGRPTLSLTHRLVTTQADGTYVFIDRHYYVSRSHNAVQAVAGVFRVAEGALVLYGNRTFTDQLGGVGAGTKQAIGRRIMGGQIAALYEQLRSNVKK